MISPFDKSMLKLRELDNLDSLISQILQSYLSQEGGPRGLKDLAAKIPLKVSKFR